MTPDLTAYYTPEELKSELSIAFGEEGWYRRGEDMVLITKDSDQLCVMIWNDRDPRPMWRKALSMPSFRLEGGDVMHKEEGWLPPMD